ncbi:hypothetical protein [uncultured Duncaniella sp.]|uniref:hypothetical protein n=1 Tax=uncultured Duncaniella sp. TaxID=2768039 RepID=UPI0026661487|nr:hypothetical protein [uncultured Duncaniella sp.]
MKDTINITQSNILEVFCKYYTAVTVDTVCSMCNCDLGDLMSADQLEAYDAEHIAWGAVKPEYENLADMYQVVEFVSEGDDVFPAEICGGRLMDISDELLNLFK